MPLRCQTRSLLDRQKLEVGGYFGEEPDGTTNLAFPGEEHSPGNSGEAACRSTTEKLQLTDSRETRKRG